MSKKIVFDTLSFIKRAREIHGDKYDYSKVKYVKSKEKVCIICPEHGEFWQTPNVHLKGGGCIKCYQNTIGERCRKTQEEFIDDMNNMYGDLYDFSECVYKTNKEKVKVICRKHGSFWVRPNDLISGYGCRLCGYEEKSKKSRHTNEVFISKAYKVHGERYDYSKVEYKTSKSKICVICPEHGEFWQTPNHHLMGHGCPRCRNSKLEMEVEEILSKYKIEFERFNRNLLTDKQSLDFYLPKYNVAIECQGIQHFEPTDFGSKGREKYFWELVKNRDEKKYNTCLNQKIDIIYYHHFQKYYGTYKNEAHDELELINEIKKYEIEWEKIQ